MKGKQQNPKAQNNHKPQNQNNQRSQNSNTYAYPQKQTSKSPMRQEQVIVQNQEFNLLSLNRNNVDQFLNSQRSQLPHQLNQISQQIQLTQHNKNSLQPQSNIHMQEKLISSSSTGFGNISNIRDSGEIRTTNPLMSPGSISLQSTEPASKRENVQVYVRIRPPFQHEIEDQQNNTYFYQNTGDNQQELWTCIQATPPCWITLQNYQDIPKEFQFNQVFTDASAQPEVFQESALPLVFHVLNGYHGCYFVYGQTGTGKTHTMGVLNQINEESQGIIPSSLDFVFKFFEQQEKDQLVSDWTVHISFYQIYQEQIQDLFNPLNKNLNIREEVGEIFVEDLVEVPVRNIDQAMNIINAGLEHRQMASQNMNQTSSRSHTILNIDVFQTKLISYNKTEQVNGRLTLVDLAGSERVRHTTSSGARLEEAKHINASLSALGNVISSLANQKSQFIPYRSSKLTRVLQNSLSGSSKIVVLATLGPSLKNYQESLSTLQFAQRCKEIVLTPLIHTNMSQDDEEVSQLKERIIEMQFDMERKDSECQNIILNMQSKYTSQEKMILDLKYENSKLRQQLSDVPIIDQEKVQQLQDLGVFMIKLNKKLSDTIGQNINEVFDYYLKIDKVNQNNKSEVAQELELEFPFNIKSKYNMNPQERLDIEPSYDIMSEDTYTLQEIAQKLSIQAKRNLEYVAQLGQATKTQILLKQYTREQIEDFHLKRDQSKLSQSENLKILLKELIELKKSQIKDSYKMYLISKKQQYTVQEKHLLKDQIVSELRTYIADEILPLLKLDELSESQEEDIDQEILNVSFTLNTLENELQTFDSMFKQGFQQVNTTQQHQTSFQNDSFNNQVSFNNHIHHSSIKDAINPAMNLFQQRNSLLENHQPERKMNSQQDNNVWINLLHNQNPQNINVRKDSNFEIESLLENEHEDDLSSSYSPSNAANQAKSNKQSSLVNGNYINRSSKSLQQQDHQNMSKLISKQQMFKKQRIFGNGSSDSSQQDVIQEEEKESDYTLQTEDRGQSPDLRSQKQETQSKSLNMNTSGNQFQISQFNETQNSGGSGNNQNQMMNTSRLKNLASKPQQSQSKVMRADKLIMLSKGFTERCMLKFINHFVAQKPDQNLGAGCGPVNPQKKMIGISQQIMNDRLNDDIKSLQNSIQPQQQPYYVQKKTKNSNLSISSSNKIRVDSSPSVSGKEEARQQHERAHSKNQNYIYSDEYDQNYNDGGSTYYKNNSKNSKQKVEIKKYKKSLESDENDEESKIVVKTNDQTIRDMQNQIRKQNFIEKGQQQQQQFSQPLNLDKRFTFSQNQIPSTSEIQRKNSQISSNSRTFYIRNGSLKTNSQESVENEDSDDQ